jgi:hypothetical protein
VTVALSLADSNATQPAVGWARRLYGISGAGLIDASALNKPEVAETEWSVSRLQDTRRHVAGKWDIETRDSERELELNF